MTDYFTLFVALALFKNHRKFSKYHDMRST